jgi:hypothetical protein
MPNVVTIHQSTAFCQVGAGCSATIRNVGSATNNGLATPDTSTVKTWHPVTGSPWNAAGDRFVFVGNTQSLWQGKPLPALRGSSTGLYVADLSGSGIPTLLDSGDDRAPTWNYLDPSAVFLVMA